MTGLLPPPRPNGCCLCGAHPAEGGAVFRVNPTGERAIWACRRCYAAAERLWVEGQLLPGGYRVPDGPP